jgi:tRNA 2-thiouridine synthesizing protein A
MAIHTINARRLLCPMPVIRTQDAIATYQCGDEVHVYGTDPGIKQDIPAWCRINGHHIIDIVEHEDDIEIIIEVGEH